jgi:hypothetical protein
VSRAALNTVHSVLRNIEGRARVGTLLTGKKFMSGEGVAGLSIAGRARRWGRGRAPRGSETHRLWVYFLLLRQCGSAAVRLCGCVAGHLPADMAVEVSVGYTPVGWACGRARGRVGGARCARGVGWEEMEDG